MPRCALLHDANIPAFRDPCITDHPLLACSGAVAMERTLGPSSKPQLSVVEQLKADQDV